MSSLESYLSHFWHTSSIYMSVGNSDVVESLSKWDKGCVDDEIVNSLVQIHRILCSYNNKMHVALLTIWPTINLYHLRWPAYLIKIYCLNILFMSVFWKLSCPMNEKCFTKLGDMIHTVKNVYMNMCSKQLYFGAIALLNIRTFSDNGMSSLLLAFFWLFTNVLGDGVWQLY